MYIHLRTYNLKKSLVQQEELNKSLKFSVYESYRDGKEKSSVRIAHLGSIHVWQLIQSPEKKEEILQGIKDKLNSPPLLVERKKLLADFNRKIAEYDPTALISDQ